MATLFSNATVLPMTSPAEGPHTFTGSVGVAGDRIDRIGTPEEIFTSDYIAQLYHLERGKYDECFSTLEFVP